MLLTLCRVDGCNTTGTIPSRPSLAYGLPGWTILSFVSLSLTYKYTSSTYWDSVESIICWSSLFLPRFFMFLGFIFYFVKLTRMPQPQSYSFWSLAIHIFIRRPGTKNGTTFSGNATIFLISRSTLDKWSFSVVFFLIWSWFDLGIFSFMP